MVDSLRRIQGIALAGMIYSKLSIAELSKIFEEQRAKLVIKFR